MSRAIDQMVESMSEKGRDEYLSAFVSSYKRVMADRGETDGLAAAQLAKTTEPNSAILLRASEEYAVSFAGGYKRGLKDRGSRDGLDAAVAAPVDTIKPKPIASEASGDG